MAAHEDVDGLDLGGVANGFADELATSAAASIKRVLRAHEYDATSLRGLRAFVETSTVWHTIGQ